MEKFKGHYNKAPEGLEIITKEDFMKNCMFHYCIGKQFSKQVYRDRTIDGVLQDKTFGLVCFPLEYFKDQEHLGFAIMNDWFDNETGRNRPQPIYRYCRYGGAERWKKFVAKFVSQFQGDNS